MGTARGAREAGRKDTGSPRPGTYGGIHTDQRASGPWAGPRCSFRREVPAVEMWRWCHLKDGFDGDAASELPLGPSRGGSRHGKPHPQQKGCSCAGVARRRGVSLSKRAPASPLAPPIWTTRGHTAGRWHRLLARPSSQDMTAQTGSAQGSRVRSLLASRRTLQAGSLAQPCSGTLCCKRGVSFPPSSRGPRSSLPFPPRTHGTPWAAPASVGQQRMEPFIRLTPFPPASQNVGFLRFSDRECCHVKSRAPGQSLRFRRGPGTRVSDTRFPSQSGLSIMLNAAWP